jgi:hypothetical protein
MPRGVGTINDFAPSPFSSEQYQITNDYITLSGPLNVIFYAGASAQNTDQGIVAELTTPTNQNDQSIQTTLKVFDAPGNVGTLTFESVKGNVLTLKNQNGKVLYFDTLTHAFS